MCSVVVQRQPGARWPLLLAANRDEMTDRPWRPPARHWSDRPNVVAGLDELAGGSWLGLNDEGVLAAILNREGTLGPQSGKRSRGELVLEALDHADAAAAARALSHLDTRAWRPFNLLVADNRDAFVVAHRGESGPGRPEVEPVGDGVHMLTAFDLDDQADPRIAFYLPLFRHATPPDPAAGAWSAWEELLASRIWDGDRGPRGAMNFRLASGFGTSSSALIALATPGGAAPGAVWRFAAGPPHETAWTPVALGGGGTEGGG
jgi:hypothetical protein